MFDIGWLELLVIAVVAIVVVGPKDLPRLMRTFGHYAGKVRRMASDFQRQFDQVMTDAELEEMQRRYQEAVEMPERVKGPPMLPVPEEARAHPQNRQTETAEAPSENATAAPKAASKSASKKSSQRAGTASRAKTAAGSKSKAASTAKRQPKTSTSASAKTAAKSTGAKSTSKTKTASKAKPAARKRPSSAARGKGTSKEQSS